MPSDYFDEGPSAVGLLKVWLSRCDSEKVLFRTVGNRTPHSCHVLMSLPQFQSYLATILAIIPGDLACLKSKLSQWDDYRFQYTAISILTDVCPRLPESNNSTYASVGAKDDESSLSQRLSSTPRVSTASSFAFHVLHCSTVLPWREIRTVCPWPSAGYK